jgi:hypothetical protein
MAKSRKARKATKSTRKAKATRTAKAKRPSTRKTTRKTTRKIASKTASKTAGKTRARSQRPADAAIRADGSRSLNYFCHPSQKCIVRPPGQQHRIGPPGTIVFLEAENTDVTITFEKESPFSSQLNERIDIPRGNSVPKVVKAGAAGRFTYRFTCAVCITNHVLAGPEMIVP